MSYNNNKPKAEYVQGIYGKMPGENDPAFKIGKMHIRPKELADFLKPYLDDEWLNVDILQQKADPTKLSFTVNKWKPKQNNQDDDESGSQSNSYEEPETPSAEANDDESGEFLPF